VATCRRATGSLNRRSLYVGMTRGRQANTAYVATGEPVPGKEPVLRPEVVLAEIIDNDGTELTATEAIRHAQEWSGGTGHLSNIWAASMRGTEEATIDGKLKDCLSEGEYRRYSASRKGSHCSRPSGNASLTARTSLLSLSGLPLLTSAAPGASPRSCTGV
jgi:hypothetical protein